MLEGGAGGSPHGGDSYVRDITEGAAISLTSDGRDGTTEDLRRHFGNLCMTDSKRPAFDAHAFLLNAGLGKRLVHLKVKERFFLQGDVADSVFYLQKGRARLTVVSNAGKEATITLLAPGEFIGEEAVGAIVGNRMATASAITACTALKIDRREMIRVIHEDHAFSDLFLAFLLARSMRTQADLVDQLFNSTEKRLARVLLLMAEFGKSSEPQALLPVITQETLAEMIGATRSRVSGFMNRFRKLGFIGYNGRIHVNKSLLNVVLHDQPFEHNALSADLLSTPPGASKSAKRIAKVVNKINQSPDKPIKKP